MWQIITNNLKGMFKLKKNQKGFTLVELIVVIAIFGTLVALVIILATLVIINMK